MTKKLNGFRNITTVLLMLLLLGIAAAPVSATNLLVSAGITAGVNATNVSINGTIRPLGTDAYNTTYINKVEALNFTIQLNPVITNVNGTATVGQWNVTNVSIDFTGTGITLSPTTSATALPSLAGGSFILPNIFDANSGFNQTNAVAVNVTSTAINITYNPALFGAGIAPGILPAINNNAAGAGNNASVLWVNVSRALMPSTANNVTITIYAYNQTVGVGTNFTFVNLTVVSDTTAPTIQTANFSFVANQQIQDSSATVTSGLDSSSKIINQMAPQTDIPGFNFTINDSSTGANSGSGVNYTSIAVILDIGTSSQQYLMLNGTTNYNSNTVVPNGRNVTIKLVPGFNATMGGTLGAGLLTAGGTTTGTSHTLTISTLDNSTIAATNLTQTFFVNRIILGANRTSNIVANGSDRINLTAKFLLPNGSIDNASTASVSWSETDASGNPISGGTTFSSSVTTNSNGYSNTAATFTTSGNHYIQAQYNGTVNNIIITTQKTVAGVTLTSAKSSTGIVANGSDTAILNAQAVDSTGANVLKSGYTVQLSELTSGYTGVTPTSGLTDSNGMLNFTVTSNTSSTTSLTFRATITLDNGSQSNSANLGLSFASGPVRTLSVNTSINGSSNASISFVGLNIPSGPTGPGSNASIDSIAAGNTTIISVNLTDDATHAVSGATVNFALSGNGSLSASSATTNSTGTATVTFTSGTFAGNLSSTINVTTSNNATLFSNVRVNTTNGTLNKIALTANRTGLATSSGANLTATLQDVNGNTVGSGNVNISFSIISGASLGNLSSSYVVTGTNGTASINFTSGSSTGTVIVQANATPTVLLGSPGNVTNITLTIGSPDNFTLSLNKTNMPTTAGWGSGSPVVVGLNLTSSGSTLGSSGVNITFLITNGTLANNNATFTPNGSTIIVLTNSTGQASVLVNGSGNIETVTLTARDNDNNSIPAQTASISFTGTASTFTLTNGTIALPDSTGRRNTTLTVQLKDSKGNNVGQSNSTTYTVTGGGTLNASGGTTDQNSGIANVILSSTTTSGAVSSTVTAYITGMSPSSQALTVTAPQPTLAVTSNVSSVTVNTAKSVNFTVTATDPTTGVSTAQAVSGVTVTLSGVGTSGSGTTDANGNVTLSVNATSAGTVTATASLTGYANGTASVTATSVTTVVKQTVGVYDNNGTWALWNTTTSTAAIVGFGFSNTTPIVGDWNLDGITDIGVYNKGGNNFIIRYPNASFTVIGLGWAGVTPVVGDWSGDGRAKVGVYDNNGTWALWNSTTGAADIVGFGFSNTIPVVGDWNGAGKKSIGVYNKGGNNFLVRYPNGSSTVIGLGWAGVTPVVGDWNGNGMSKVGVYDGNGTWALWNSTTGAADIVGFGFSNTTPVVGNWDGDGRTNVGVYNKAGNNFLIRHTNGTFDVIGLGWSGVTPVVGKWS